MFGLATDTLDVGFGLIGTLGLYVDIYRVSLKINEVQCNSLHI